MATSSLKRLSFTFVKRPAPKSGPPSSDVWNASARELAVDLASLSLEWNSKILPLTSALPDGSLDGAVNAIKYGLDGKNMWVDHNVVSTSNDLTFYNSTAARPATLEEAFRSLYTYVDTQVEAIRDDVIETSGALTTDQKARIGANVFDASTTSSASSLDGKSELSRLNLLQLAKDLYGPSYVLNGDGNSILNNTVYAMVDALLALHNGAWDDDIALSHAGAFAVAQVDVGTSATVNDGFTDPPTDLEEDLNQIRNKIKVLKGTVAWGGALSALYTAGPDSLEDLLVNTSGTGTKAASNPWGYNYSDIDGLVTRLNAIATYTGMDNLTDSTPDYIGTTYIQTGDSLELAAGKLDGAIAIQSGITSTLVSDLDTLETTVAGIGSGAGEVSAITTVNNIDAAVIWQLELEADQAAWVDANVIARDTVSGENSAFWKCSVRAIRKGTDPVECGDTFYLIEDEDTYDDWDCYFVPSGQYLQLLVSGVNMEIDWKSTTTYQQV